MDILLGRLRVRLTPVDAISLSFSTGLELYSFRTKKLDKAHKFYSWDCETQTGEPPVQRPNVLMRTQFEIPNRSEIGPFGGGLFGGGYDVDTNAQWIAGAGFNTAQEFVAETQTRFPPVKVPVDWDKLWRPIKDQYSFGLFVQFRYRVFICRPTAMHELDYMLLAVPHLAVFYSSITGRCTGGSLPNGVPPTSDAGTPDPDEVSDAIRELHEAHQRETREAEEVRERLEGEFPGFPSPEDLEGF